MEVTSDVLRHIVSFLPSTEWGCLAGTCKAMLELLPSPWTTDPYVSRSRLDWSGVSWAEVCEVTMGKAGSLTVLQDFVVAHVCHKDHLGTALSINRLLLGAAEANHMHIINFFLLPGFTLADQCVPCQVYNVVYGAIRGGHVVILQEMADRFDVFRRACNQYHVNVVRLAIDCQHDHVAEWIVLHSNKDPRLLADTIIPTGSFYTFYNIVNSFFDVELEFMRQEREFFAYMCVVHRRETFIRYLQHRRILPDDTEALCDMMVRQHAFMVGILAPEWSDAVDLDVELSWVECKFGRSQQESVR